MNAYSFSTNKTYSTDAACMAPECSCAFSDIVITSGTVVNAVSVFVMRLINIISSIIVVNIIGLLKKSKSKALSMDILI